MQDATVISSDSIMFRILFVEAPHAPEFMIEDSLRSQSMRGCYMKRLPIFGDGLTRLAQSALSRGILLVGVVAGSLMLAMLGVALSQSEHPGSPSEVYLDFRALMKAATSL